MKSNESFPGESCDGLTKLFLLFVGYQLLLHTYFAFSSNDPRLFMPTAIAFLHDVCILGIIAAIGYFVTFTFPNRLKKTIERIYPIILIIVGGVLASYPKILRENLAFPVNIFDSDISSAKVLIFDYLGISALLPSLIALFFGVLFLLLT